MCARAHIFMKEMFSGPHNSKVFGSFQVSRLRLKLGSGQGQGYSFSGSG